MVHLLVLTICWFCLPVLIFKVSQGSFQKLKNKYLLMYNVYRIVSQLKDLIFLYFRFDLTNRSSFQSVKVWVDHIRTYAAKADPVIYLVGNKVISYSTTTQPRHQERLIYPLQAQHLICLSQKFFL